MTYKNNRVILSLIACMALFISTDFYYYIPIFFFFLFFISTEKIKTSIQITILTLFIIAYLLFFLFNSDELILPNPNLSIFRYVFLILIAYLIFCIKNPKYLDFFLISICIFLLLNNYITIAYSYFLFKTQDLHVGYGLLFDPIHSTYVKSPKVALQVLFSTATLSLYSLKNTKMSLIIITIGLILSFYIQSRTTFILLNALFLLKIYRSYKLNIKNILLFSSLIVFLLIYCLLTFNELSPNYASIESSRITKSLLESSRFSLWADGINQMISNPFGNFKTDYNTLETFYFHNIIIDSARIYGWLSTILLVYFFTFTLCKVIKINKIEISLLFSIYVLVMFQDVVIEGGFHLFFITYIVTLILHKKTLTHE